MIANALLLYYEQRHSLFADHFVSEKLNTAPDFIRSKIRDCLHTSPEELVSYLEPGRIKRVISKTTADMRDKHYSYSPFQIEPMTAEETEHGGASLSIHYRFENTCFGSVIIASTAKGVCYLAFSDNGNKTALDLLKIRFPNASFKETKDDFQKHALSAFEKRNNSGHLIHLHVKGTPFQINTWKKLLEIPLSGLMSYSALANNKKDSHALGAAIGSNPIAYIIPCHRTVRASGEFGEYHWGTARKAALICMEAINVL